MRVLLAVSSIDDSYGGPAVSVAGLASVLSGSGLAVALWAPRSSATGLERARRRGLPAFGGGLDDLVTAFGEPDLVHDNGIWRDHNHRLAAYCRSRAIPRVVSPRGMLSPWALNHKRTKKRLAWWVYQRRDVETAIRLHATSEAEALDLEALAVGPPIEVIPNGVCTGEGSSLPSSGACLPPDGRRQALFLGRLYPVKGLPLLIDAWAQVRPPGWTLVLAGPDENGHRRELEEQVDRHGLQREIRFTGPVGPAEKWEWLRSADLMVLPSLSESFGMAVAEALACGTPVITTTAAPWSKLRSHGCGWWCEPTVSALAEALSEATRLEPARLVERGARGRLVAAEFDWSRLTARYLQAYEAALAAGRSPEGKSP